jgi:formamidopyrimidine-DNA glycosylase
MPELPEVETVRRTLAPAVGATIRAAWDSGKGLHMHRKPPRAKLRSLVGARISAVRRHGKYLLVDLVQHGKPPMVLLVHLGMTGRLLVLDAKVPRAKHTHLVLSLGARELRFVDARRFGQLDVFALADEREQSALAGLGPDPIVDGIDRAAFLARSRGKKATLKAFLLDQAVLAGVGNIYASEALWRAQLRPTMRAHRLTAASSARLADAIDEVLHHALTKGGTSLRDFVNAEGSAGENAEYLWVYGRAGEPCQRCKTPIRRSVLQGRATFSCPTCQTR